jgi:hypothetical protein
MVALKHTFSITAPAQEAISAAASTGQQAPGDTVMSSRPSSSVSEFSTPSVAESVEFAETNPEALRGLGIDVIEQEAPRDTTMNDTESDSEMEQISTDATLVPIPVQQACIFFYFHIEKFSFHTFGFSKSMKSCVFILLDFPKV